MKPRLSPFAAILITVMAGCWAAALPLAAQTGGRTNQAGRPRADSYEDRSLGERCIAGFNAGPPMTPGAYNNNVQIVQAPGYVAILNEMVHDARIVPLDARPRLAIPQKHGDSRGRWDGNTLVVETTNFNHGLAGVLAGARADEKAKRSR